MTTLQITLSDDIAKRAKAAGLLESARLEELLSARLSAQTDLENLLLEGLVGEATPWSAEDSNQLRVRAKSAN